MDNGEKSQTLSIERADSHRIPPRRRPSWIARSLGGCRKGLRIFGQFLLIAWATLAIYFSNLPWAWARLGAAIVFAAFAVWSLWIARRREMRWAFTAVFAGVLIWWICIPPLQYRPWRGDVAVLPRAIIDGDRVRIVNVRNFVYRSRHDFDARYEEREFSLARVSSLDLFISYWRVGPVGHTFVSFNFDDGSPPLSISIETRPEVGEGFDPLASMFKQFELIYVVADEHDVVGSRASHRNEEVFLYRIISEPGGVRRLLSYYLDRINELADRPEWYHLLTNSCTINIFRYANAAGRQGRFDMRQLLNGWVDAYLYATGWLETTLPFEELRERSRITDVAKAAADAPDFSQRIRAYLPPATEPDTHDTNNTHYRND
jgi:hypothetical protein